MVASGGSHKPRFASVTVSARGRVWRGGPVAVAVICACVSTLVFSFVRGCQRSAECQERGGVLVSTWDGRACVRPMAEEP